MGEAWITLAANDDYARGALVLAHSLKNVATTRKTHCLITSYVTPRVTAELNAQFDEVTTVDVLSNVDEENQALIGRTDLSVTFTKLHCWRLTQYTKAVFLDADTMVMQNSDELFDRPAFAAAADIGWPDCFNSGVFVFAPSLETYRALLTMALSGGSFDGGDQGLLNEFFSNWRDLSSEHRLPFIYNMTAGSFYSYAAAYKRFGASTKIVHFIGKVKPWHGSTTGHQGAHFQQWHSIYERNFAERDSPIFKQLEATRHVDVQHAKVLYGIVRDDVWLAMEKRKMRGKEPKNAKKATAAAPPPERIPLPPVTENYREERRKSLRDVSKMAFVTEDTPPSVCMFTALNAHGGVTGCDISDDTSMLALGYGDSTINLFSFDENQKIRRLKEMEELEKIDMDADNLTELLYDDSTAASNVVLMGHGGPVYSVSFSPDKRLLASSARDNTIRLWSTDTQKNVIVYRMSMPVWQVQFCNRGYYFCSGGADKTAALWCTDRMHPLRLFPDSFDHVSCVDFHPNCNYIAGGSDDRYVRLWDVLTGACVRTFTGHRAGVRGVKVSPCGRYIVSVSGDGAVCVWDIAQNRMVGMETRPAQATMGAISFSRDGGSFALSCGANSVSVYSIDNLIAAMENQKFSFDPKVNTPGFNMFSFPTKQTPVLGLHFTRRNLILAVGSFNQ